MTQVERSLLAQPWVQATAAQRHVQQVGDEPVAEQGHGLGVCRIGHEALLLVEEFRP
jgi:hypothetical protein